MRHVAGLDETPTGPVHGSDESARGALVRPVSLTRTMVEAVDGHDGPQRLNGVGALVLSRRD
jgi:hypothetical protein